MRIRAFCLLLSLAFALAACGGGQSGFNPPANDRTAVTPMSAQSVTSNLKVPLQLTVFIPCAAGGSGETVTLTGNLHILATTTIDANGFHLKTLFNPQGISGLGSVTGDKYQGTGETEQEVNVANPSFPLTLSFVNNFKIIGQGPGNNFLIHENAHLTVNANGTVTVSDDHLTIACK